MTARAGGSGQAAGSGEAAPRPGFFYRLHRGSLAIFLVALLLSLRWGSWRVPVGVAAGWGVASALLVYWQLVVRVAFRAERPRPVLVAVSLLVKLPAVGALVWWWISRGWGSPPAFAVGFALPQVAVAVMAIGGGWVGGDASAPTAEKNRETGARRAGSPSSCAAHLRT